MINRTISLSRSGSITSCFSLTVYLSSSTSRISIKSLDRNRRQTAPQPHIFNARLHLALDRSSVKPPPVKSPVIWPQGGWASFDQIGNLPKAAICDRADRAGKARPECLATSMLLQVPLTRQSYPFAYFLGMLRLLACLFGPVKEISRMLLYTVR